MDLKIKPIFILSRGANQFRHPDGTREVVSDEAEINQRLSQISQELRATLRYGYSLLNDSFVRDEEELKQLRPELVQADGMLLYCIGFFPIQSVFDWQLPIVAFGGQYTPAATLTACGAERHSNLKITIALDYQEIDDALTIIHTRKKLHTERIALFGFMPDPYSRWHHLPDFELAKRKLGVQVNAVELRELVALSKTIDGEKLDELVKTWIKEAKEVIEPKETDIRETARIYSALKMLLEQEKANAFGINCLEMIKTLGVLPPCYALTRLRDEGTHAACEADLVCLLTMMLLGYIAGAPAFMGNTVAAIPASNTISISHCVTPTKMAGFEARAKPYILRNYHSGPGVTAHVELNTGQEVTVARLSREFDKICIAQGKLVECRDTIGCRTTISISISDAREFVQRTFGNHQAVAYGNHIKLMNKLCHKMDIQTIVV